MNIDGVNTQLSVPLYSPLTTNVEIVKYGSNRLRAKLNHIPALDLPSARLREPITKGKNFKARGTSVKQKLVDGPKNKSKGKIRRYISAQSGVNFKS